tara:strand:+ start:2488 stop:3048 length:561 start_codon:yes stop_codon:yes gene_type:complete
MAYRENNELSSNDIVCFNNGNNITAGGYTINSCFLRNNFLPLSKSKLNDNKLDNLINELSIPAGLLSLQNNVIRDASVDDDDSDDIDKIIDIHINNKNRKHSYNDFYFNDDEDENKLTNDIDNDKYSRNKVISSELYDKLLDIVDTVTSERKKPKEKKQTKNKGNKFKKVNKKTKKQNKKQNKKTK